MIISATLKTSKASSFCANTTGYRRLGVAVSIASALLVVNHANAAAEITINQSATGSTTVVEQYADGKTAVITSSPNSITMQDNRPISVTGAASNTRYLPSQGTVSVTSMPVNTRGTTQRVDVIAVPTTLVAPTLITNTPPITSQVITLDRLQLTPTFSTSDIVSANTKVMKILKDSSGRDIAVPAHSIKSGDIIEYHTTYTSAQPVSDVDATVAFPNGVKLVSLNSPLPTMASVDGDRYQALPQATGNTALQDNYSGLRWNLANINANMPKTVVIRAQVE